MSIKELVKEINTALANEEMTIEAAERIIPFIEQMTGRPTTIFARRVTFYDKTTVTKWEKLNDAYVNL